jgi:hypothetical protein
MASARQIAVSVAPSETAWQMSLMSCVSASIVGTGGAGTKALVLALGLTFDLDKVLHLLFSGFGGFFGDFHYGDWVSCYRIITMFEVVAPVHFVKLTDSTANKEDCVAFYSWTLDDCSVI